MTDDDITIVFRRESGRVLAGLVRRFGDIDVAEEAVQEAFLVAIEHWRRDGIPPNPGGWIATTARNRAIDRVRRESSRQERSVAAMRLHSPSGDRPEDLDPVRDDRLRLIFTCCHPALEPAAQIALTLRLIAGLQTAEIARAFLVPETTLAQRLLRAKRKIAANKIPYRIPTESELPDRLPPVLAVVYLIFNEGHTATAADTLVRTDLCDEATRLGRLLVTLMPDEPEAIGLLALMLLVHARTPARQDEQGRLVLLADQDRARWNRDAIDEGHALVRRCLHANHPGPYQFQAAINAVHADAAHFDATDWSQIVTLYDQYYAAEPNAIVALNRAIAIGERDGAETGLRRLDDLPLDRYPYYHTARAEFLQRLDRLTEADAALDAAIALTDNRIERRHLTNRQTKIRDRRSGIADGA